MVYFSANFDLKSLKLPMMASNPKEVQERPIIGKARHGLARQPASPLLGGAGLRFGIAGIGGAGRASLFDTPKCVNLSKLANASITFETRYAIRLNSLAPRPPKVGNLHQHFVLSRQLQ
ncbi:hypothetical protein PIB30_048482 [Stylosanthes scabra]|uniref:Uncharacterized protein n=1 Tax=Stylosanthes scabra TaxID=79078 RepID=A0ABU6RHS7_9FABA|nr:hypothetical protein [Stylosanthes scabra]